MIGRRLTARLDDRLRSETMLIFLTAAALLLLFAAVNIAWVLHPDWQSFSLTSGAGASVAFAAFCALALLAGGLVGFSPRIDISVADSRIVVETRGSRHVIPFEDIAQAEVIPALVFHRHYRRYRRTLIFVNKVPESLVLIWVDEQPIVIGIPPERQPSFLDALRAGIPDVVIETGGDAARLQDAAAHPTA